jgi:hypothetical protein
MAFAQLTYRESLRDIVACLNAKSGALHHLGFSEPVAKSTLAAANETRDWRLWEDPARHLIGRATPLHAGEDTGMELDNVIYALDSTTIDLSLALFPWADFRTTKAGIKMHTQLDVRGAIPTCIRVTDARPPLPGDRRSVGKNHALDGCGAVRGGGWHGGGDFRRAVVPYGGVAQNVL